MLQRRSRLPPGSRHVRRLRYFFSSHVPPDRDAQARGDGGGDVEGDRVVIQELPEGTLTVLFTDVVGSTDLVTRLGDEPAREVLRACDELVRRQVARHRGQEVSPRCTADPPEPCIPCFRASKRLLPEGPARTGDGSNRGARTAETLGRVYSLLPPFSLG